MVVRAHRLLGVVERVAQDLVGAVGDHLVHIHIVAGARASLEGIDYELAGVLAVEHFLRSRDNRACALLVEQPKVAVDLGRRALDQGLRPHKGRVGALPADRKVQHCPLRLRTVERVGGHLHLAKRVFFNSVCLRHRTMPPLDRYFRNARMVA